MLQSTPEVSVGADGQILVKGNPQVTVLVDGKPALDSFISSHGAFMSAL